MVYNLFEMCDRAIRYISESLNVSMEAACHIFIIDYCINPTAEIYDQMDNYLERF